MKKSPTACRPLADWLGQNVRFEGYLNYWGTADKTGDSSFLLQNIKAIPYKGRQDQLRTLDHIWLYMNKDIYEPPRCERFGRYAALGKVVSYTRSNGTKDYAIDIKKYVPIEAHLDLLKPYEGYKLNHVQAKTIILKETLNLLDIEELDFGVHLSYKDVYQHFQDEYEFCHRQVEINERYEAKKQHRPRPNMKDIKFTSAAPKSTKVAGKGFAIS
ncbi:hypothetical protein [Leptolyngbya sp. FACHB-261]|uniref:hypothetical protein n=1 Tax=Leptolyngbya sp. FACHB-261 TaxID=2692806 RepID=UPI0016896879|nr:hypothetical protein [Leptolyngbya sp. FACHB-261]MBD2100376.1 hypothetical protein [Leptolyngbya sp. FACHB-261]